MASSIAQAEGARPRKGPKVIDHIEIHPKLGGGHIVKHVYSGYQHEPAEYNFNKNGIAKGGEHIQDHLEKHAGLPEAGGEPKPETEEEIEA